MLRQLRMPRQVGTLRQLRCTPRAPRALKHPLTLSADLRMTMPPASVLAACGLVASGGIAPCALAFAPAVGFCGVQLSVTRAVSFFEV